MQYEYDVPIEFVILLALAMMALVALFSAFTKQGRIQDQTKREKFCKDRQQGLLLEIEGAPRLAVLASLEDAVDHFAEDFQGRIDRKLYRDLVGELHAAVYNRREKLKSFDAGMRQPKKNATFPFWQ